MLNSEIFLSFSVKITPAGPSIAIEHFNTSNPPGSAFHFLSGVLECKDLFGINGHSNLLFFANMENELDNTLNVPIKCYRRRQTGLLKQISIEPQIYGFFCFTIDGRFNRFITVMLFWIGRTAGSSS